MRKWLMMALAAGLLLAAAGCAKSRKPLDTGVSVPQVEPAQGQQGQSGQQQEPAPVQNGGQAGAPGSIARSLWAEPGGYLATEDGGFLARSYRPFTLNGKLVMPVRTRQGMIYVHQDETGVWLDAVDSFRGGLYPLPEARLLHRLPLAAGQEWAIPFGAPMGDTDPVRFKVMAVAEAETPAGRLPVAKVWAGRETGKPGDSAVENWVPGYGILSLEQSSKGPWQATRVIKGEPAESPVVGHPAPGITALIDDDNQRYRVVTDGGKELAVIPDSYWRSWYSWKRAGERDLLWHSHFPGSWGVFGYSAALYNPASGRFDPVKFISAAGEQTNLAGTVLPVTGEEALVHNDFIGYPQRFYTYRWDEKALAFRADPKEDQVKRAETALALAERLISPPPLGEKDFTALFANPDLGRQAWAQLQAANWRPLTTGEVQPVAGAPAGTFRIGAGNGQFQVRIVKGPADWQIIAFQMQK